MCETQLNEPEKETSETAPSLHLFLEAKHGVVEHGGAEDPFKPFESKLPRAFAVRGKRSVG
jgi:hypothetical protein